MYQRFPELRLPETSQVVNWVVWKSVTTENPLVAGFFVKRYLSYGKFFYLYPPKIFELANEDQ